VGGGLDVVIVTYRCRELARACLASVLCQSTRRAISVVLIDNDSRDGTVELVRHDFPDVDVIASNENLGFARATNLGIRSGASEYVLALNPDTRLAEGTLDRMLDVLDERPEVGISGCRLVQDDGSDDHAAKRSFPTPLSALGHFTGLARLRAVPHALRAYTAPHVESGPVDAVNGAFMLMRRRALEQVGLFDEGYWMYMEDLDLCYRFAQAGWVTWYEPGATAVHIKGGTSGRSRSFRLNRAFHYGMFRFYRRHYARGHGHALNALVYGGIATRFALAVASSALRRGVGAHG
jgi:GT2 family glycosyltransferase